MLTSVIVSVTLTLTGSYRYSQAFKIFVPELAHEERAKAELERRREMEDTSLPAMLKFNRDQMALYHTIATTQAKVAGRNSQLAILVGFVVLALGASVAVLSSDLTTKVVTASLASLGGIFSAYITKTFFVAQDRAIRQLYDYWQQPLASSYLLTAERIASELISESSRDEQVAKLITRILEVSGHHADRVDTATPSAMSSNRSVTGDVGAQAAPKSDFASN